MMAAHLTAPSTAAKNETISRMSPSSGNRNVPFMTWMKWPMEPVHVGGSSSHDSMTDLSSVAPSSIHLNSPAMAKTMAIAWMTTSIAMMSATIRYVLRISTPCGGPSTFHDEPAGRFCLGYQPSGDGVEQPRVDVVDEAADEDVVADERVAPHPHHVGSHGVLLVDDR